VLAALPPFDAALAALLATVLVAGVARGLSGFGTGMIVAPVAGALYGPQVAVVVIVVMDSLPVLPVTLPALRIARWREVLPVTAGLMLLLPVGIWLLREGDPVVLRWAISLAVLACAATTPSITGTGANRPAAQRLAIDRNSPRKNRASMLARRIAAGRPDATQ
jgi:uncharacterized membrane protein YfcA